MPIHIPEKPELTDTQAQILDAAIRCVERLGLQQTTLNDIAQEAKVARSTDYTHYLNRDDVIRFALLHSGYCFVEKIANAIEEVPQGAERLVEATLFALQTLPNEPCLMLITDHNLNKMVNEHTLTTEAGFAITTAIVEFLVGIAPDAKGTIQQQAEIALRTFLSLLTLQSPEPRDTESLRAFIKAWLLPPLGLDTPKEHK
jgi:AcrR family transcriptional regulator